MFLKQSNIQLLIFLLTIFILSGCASNTKHFIPDQLQAVPDGYARVVVTREKQLAGMTTPLYILDIGDQLESNGEVVVRVGDWIKEPGLSLWYMPDMLSSFSSGGFVLMPTDNIKFEESKLHLDDLFEKNLNAVIYVDYLSCNPDELTTLFCGDGNKECSSIFKQELNQKNGNILNTLNSNKNKNNRRKVQVIGKVGGGDTLIWDRKPGLMRIGALWGAFNKSDDIVELTPGNIIIEAGKIYYLNYEISLGDQTKRGDRWTITQVK